MDNLLNMINLVKNDLCNNVIKRLDKLKIIIIKENEIKLKKIDEENARLINESEKYMKLYSDLKIQKGGILGKIVKSVDPRQVARKAVKPLKDAFNNLMNPAKEFFNTISNVNKLFDIFQTIPKKLLNMIDMCSLLENTIGKGMKTIGEKMPKLFKWMGMLADNIESLIHWFINNVIFRIVKFMKTILEFFTKMQDRIDIDFPEWLDLENHPR